MKVDTSSILPTAEEFIALNEAMALRALVDLGQEIDRRWDTEDQRQSLLAHFDTLLRLTSQHRSPIVQSLHKLSVHLIHCQNHQSFLNFLIPIERQFTRTTADHDFIVIENDRPIPLSPPISVSVILENIRSAFNVGAVFRTAECFGLKDLILTGYTPTPDQISTTKTAMGTAQMLPWRNSPYALDVIQEFKAAGIPVIAVERTSQSIDCSTFKFPQQCALVLGNERHGINPDTIAATDACVHIPMYGRKNSLNVGIAFGIIANEIRNQRLRNWSSNS